MRSPDLFGAASVFCSREFFGLVEFLSILFSRFVCGHRERSDLVAQGKYDGKKKAQCLSALRQL
jgi:hypothetical protein